MSRILSIESIIVFNAVSNPIVKSVPPISLSIVAGMLIQGKPFSESFNAPWKLPSPPITTKPSIPCSFKFLIACS